MNRNLRNTHFFWLLIVAVFFHSAAPAFALPIQAKTEAVSTTTVAAAHSAEHCQESVDSGASHHQSHDQSSCQIACDQSSAPALVTASAPDTGETPAVMIPVLHALLLANASPPDHPPPI
jgi:hypothetical protein